jgi:hypothetical protein
MRSAARTLSGRRLPDIRSGGTSQADDEGRGRVEGGAECAAAKAEGLNASAEDCDEKDW